MALGLIRLYRIASSRPDDWIPVRELGVSTNGGEFAQLLHWGFIEDVAARNDWKARRSGLYKITETGKQFVTGAIDAPGHAFTYNQTLYGFSDGRTTIKQALGDAFDYAELMSAR